MYVCIYMYIYILRGNPLYKLSLGVKQTTIEVWSPLKTMVPCTSCGSQMACFGKCTGKILDRSFKTITILISIGLHFKFVILQVRPQQHPATSVSCNQKAKEDYLFHLSTPSIISLFLECRANMKTWHAQYLNMCWRGVQHRSTTIPSAKTSWRMVYRACVLMFFLNPAVCASFHLLVFATFSERENLRLYGLCPQLHGDFCPCCAVLATTSFEHPCSKSCFCTM